MKFEEFLYKVDETFMSNQPPKVSDANRWRYGQTIMNVLHDVWHKKYLEITDSDMDCFYTNRNVDILLNKLEKEWHEKVS